MRKKAVLILFICLVAGCISMLRAQDRLVVHSTDGSQWESLIGASGKITFSETAIIFSGNQEPIKDYLYEEVRKITFSLSSTAIPSYEAKVSDLFIYPNPAVDYVSVSGYNRDEVASIAIYSLNGMLYISIEQWDGSPIPVSTLPTGSYIININNHAIKFIKL